MKTKQEFITDLQQVVAPYADEGVDVEQITEATNFTEDLGVDSASLVDIVLDVEEKYQIEIDNESMERMFTVGAAIEIIEEKLAAT